MLRSEDASELDRYLRALQNRHRRCILYYLSETSVADIEELAQQITTEKSGSDRATTVEENREFVQTKLLHNHLPRLRDLGLVEYDERNRDVRLVDCPRVLSVLLGVCLLVETE